VSRESCLHLQPHLSTLALCLLTLPVLAAAQVQTQSSAQAVLPLATASSSEQSEVPDVPGLAAALRGLNGGITLSALHDSITGWATLATPAIGYNVNDHFNIDITVPIYFYRLAESRSLRPKHNAQLVNQRAEVGDVVFGLHGLLDSKFVGYQVTGAVTAPTGDKAYGLTSGRVTFDVTNHFERAFRKITPTLDIGIGDSSTLVNRLVTKNYTSLGPLAHFQTGLGITLFHDISFESDAYEQLPVGDQKTYGPSRKGKATVVTGRNITEDNGFTSSLDIPLDRHTTFSTYYNRSLRIRSDTVSVGITYVLRPAPMPDLPDPSLDDLFR